MQKNHKILVVDDDTMICVSLTGLLEENGYHVYAASHQDEAIHVLMKYAVDLILLDLRLHDVAELSLVNRIKEVSPETIILVMIDQDKIKTVINTLCLDTVDYILKPFDLDYLKKAIEKALYKQQLEASLKRTLTEKEIISNTNKIIAASLDIRESFSDVCSELKKIIRPFDRACLITSNEQGQWFQVFALTKTYHFSEVTCGLSGSGKTWLARQLGARLGALHLRSDVERKRLAGLEPHDDSRSPPDAGIYTLEFNDRTYARLHDCAAAALSGGETVIVDAAFLRRGERRRFLDLARSRGAPVSILHCRAPAAVLRERVAARSAARTDASEAGLDVLARQPSTGNAFDADELPRVLEVDTSLAASVTGALERLGSLAQR